MSFYNGETKVKNRIGIRRESKDETERRAPLTPGQIETIIRDSGVEVTVQPAANRIFPEASYQRAGARIAENLEDCNIIFGVKEIPLQDFLPKQAYCFFSHTIKGQSYNMPMLKHILDLRNTLIDYEKVTDERGRRLIFFGHFAGYAGMINCLWTLGQRLKWEGFHTPFASIRQALTYDSLEAAKEAVRQAGEKIGAHGLPESLTPLITGFAGYGKVSQGAQEIFNLLPVQEIFPRDLAAFVESGNHSNKTVYKVVFKEEDMVRPRSPELNFNLQDYYHHPEKYTGIFTSYLPYLTVLINGIYWEPRYPRLVTKAYVSSLYSTERRPRLRVIGDITCDIQGSIECNLKATNSKNPVYVYQPLTDSVVDGWEGTGPVILAVDKLPAEFPREASAAFGESLLPFVPHLARADYSAGYDQLKLPSEFKGAVIAHQGSLAPDFKYLKKYIR